MDLITLAMAKGYTDKQRLAYAEGENQIITFDGDTTGKSVVGNYVKVSNNTPDLNTLVKMTYTRVPDNGTVTTSETTKSSIVVTETEYGQFVSENNSVPYVKAFKKPYDGYEVGLYTYCIRNNREESIDYYAPLEFAETVHTIDPKYLPNDTIDFAPYDLGIPAIVLAGGGTKEIMDAEKAQHFFGQIREKKPKYALITLAQEVYRCAIAVSVEEALGMFLIAVQMGTLITAKIFISPIYTAGGYDGITISVEVS